jgi:nucleotide-binding universal stress UspA family protein
MREGVEVTGAVRSGARAFEIIQAAEEFNADLLVFGAQGLSRLEAFFIGSIARNVARHARCPVLVAREPKQDLRQVVLAVDQSEHASQAADFTARLPLPGASEVTLVHVVRPYQPYPRLVPDDPAGCQREIETVRRKLHHMATELVELTRLQVETAGKRVTTAVRDGDPAAEVLKLAAEQNADLIIAGARGTSFIQGLLVGSVADRLLTSSECSVLLVR